MTKYKRWSLQQNPKQKGHNKYGGGTLLVLNDKGRQWK
jgi:hypothetical protein